MERASCRTSGRKGRGYYEELKVDVLSEEEEEGEEVDLNDDAVFEVERVVQRRVRKVCAYSTDLLLLLILLLERS